MHAKIQRYCSVINLIFLRYVAQKKYDDVKGLLESGATLLLKHGETNAGTELALLLIDVYTKANTPSNEAIGKCEVNFRMPLFDVC